MTVEGRRKDEGALQANLEEKRSGLRRVDKRQTNLYYADRDMDSQNVRTGIEPPSVAVRDCRGTANNQRIHFPGTPNPCQAGLSRGLVGEALTNQFSPSFWQCETLGRVVIRFVLLHSGIQGWKLTWNTSPQQVHPRHLVLTPSIPSYCRVKTKWGTLETIQTQLSYIFPLGPPSLDVRSIAIHY